MALPARREGHPEPLHHPGEDELSHRLEKIWESPRGLWGWLTTVDHKKIGTRYLATAMLFLVVGGVEALVIRIQLALPEAHVISPEAYNQFFSMHGATMILWYAAPVLSGFGNYLVPLFIGSRDMSFPRLNAFSYWTFLLSGLLLYSSLFFGTAPDTGWFSYVPLAGRRFDPDLNVDFYAVALILFTISNTAGAINFVSTILKHRAPGMTVSRMPLFLYSTGTASMLSILAMPALAVGCVFLELDRQWGFHFFEVNRGGDAILWQHLFWFFGHPWVYIVFLPATGMISLLLPVFARRPIVGYPYVAGATVMTGIVGMGVWVHHMFAIGMGQMAMSFFAAASMTISLFSTIQIFCWLATLFLGKPVRTTALLFALGFIATFVIGGLSGVVTAVIPFDWQVHDTYFVVAHLHYVLIGANVFPVIAGFYYWLPKMTGRLLSERLGKWSFWISFVGFNVGFFPMHLSGLLGMRRRVYTFLAGDGISSFNLLTTIGAFVLAAGILISVINFFWSLKKGRPAGPNPWHADTLEWATSSPPRAHAFTRQPTVNSLHPLWDEHGTWAEPLDHGRQTLSTTKIDAEPESISTGEPETILPLLLALGLTAILCALLAKSLPLAAVFTVVSLALAGIWMWPVLPEHGEPESFGSLKIDETRGTLGMKLFIASEAILFVCLFFAYFYLGHRNMEWPTEPPKLAKALIMLAMLLASSVVLHFAEKRKDRILLAGTIVLAFGFLAVQVSEYREHLQTLKPWDSAYGSTFYTLTSFHAVHLIIGLSMLIFALILPRLEPREHTPHKPLHNSTIYWHFVDVIWVCIVGLLYVLPRFK
ncbi:MAG: cytochrome c oxidase subunit I [Myxococcales bacterium]